MIGKNDLRYQARCYKCKVHLGDWALDFPVEKRLCYDHRHWDLKKEVKPFATPSSEVRQSSMVV